MQDSSFSNIEGYMKKGHYNKALYALLCGLLPAPPKSGVPTTEKKMCNLLINVYNVLPRLLVSDPMKKAVYLIYISGCINNKVNRDFIPKNDDNIELSSRLQKVALFYIYKAIQVLQSHSITIPFERVSELNYMLNIIDFNLHVICLSEVGRIYNTSRDLQKGLKIIEHRVEQLIKNDPKPEYYTLQSSILLYQGKSAESNQAIRNSIKSVNQSRSFADLCTNSYRWLHAGKLMKVEIFGAETRAMVHR